MHNTRASLDVYGNIHIGNPGMYAGYPLTTTRHQKSISLSWEIPAVTMKMQTYFFVLIVFTLSCTLRWWHVICLPKIICDDLVFSVSSYSPRNVQISRTKDQDDSLVRSCRPAKKEGLKVNTRKKKQKQKNTETHPYLAVRRG